MNSSRHLPLLTKSDSRSNQIRVAFLGVKAKKSGRRQNLHAADPVAEALSRLKRRASLYQNLAEITRS